MCHVFVVSVTDAVLGVNQRLREFLVLSNCRVNKVLKAIIVFHISASPQQQAHIIAYKWSNKFDVVVFLKRNSCLDYDPKTKEVRRYSSPFTSAFASLLTKLDKRNLQRKTFCFCEAIKSVFNFCLPRISFSSFLSRR